MLSCTVLRWPAQTAGGFTLGVNTAAAMISYAKQRLLLPFAVAQPYIDEAQLRGLAEPLKKNGYGRYLLQMLTDKVF